MSNTTSWTARVEWLDHTGGYNEARIDEIVDALEGLSPALGFEHDDRPGYPVACSATVTLEDSSLRQAFAAAVKAVEAATGARAIAAEVLPTHEFDRRQEIPTIPDLVGLSEIARMADVSRQRAAQLTALEGFPPAVVTVGSGGGLRVKSQVDLWLRAWERKPGRPKAAAD